MKRVFLALAAVAALGVSAVMAAASVDEGLFNINHDVAVHSADPAPPDILGNDAVFEDVLPVVADLATGSEDMERPCVSDVGTHVTFGSAQITHAAAAPFEVGWRAPGA